MSLHKDIIQHPGVILLNAYIEPSGMSLNQAAVKIGTSVASLSRLTTCKSSMSADMAVKLEKVFKRTAKSWMIAQVNYDLAKLK